MKNKFLVSTLAVLALCGTTFSMTSCGEKKNSAVEAAVKDAMTLDRDALLQKAADELAANPSFRWVGCSSRAKKAASYFRAELAKKNPICADEIKVPFHWEVLDDGHIYTRLVGDIKANANDSFDGALVQDGYQLSQFGDQFVNYVPKEWTGDASNKEPFSLQYNFKTWLVNDSNGDEAIPDNVWDFTDTGKHIQTMDPNNENVNRDWLIMLTKTEYNTMLKDAWNALSETEKAAKGVNPDADEFKSYGEKKYAYAFIAGYIKNAIFQKDDGAAVNAFAVKTAKGSYGWIVYSKMMNLAETDTVSKKWIVSPALGKENTDGNTATMKMKGFGGFMYKHYLQVMPNTKHPYTTCALINILSTTKEGYNGWAKDIGDYPSMSSVNLDRTKFGHGTLATEKNDKGEYAYTQDNNGENVFAVMNDPKSDWWISKTGGNAVIEEPAYIGKNYDAVNDFIVTQTNKKK